MFKKTFLIFITALMSLGLSISFQSLLAAWTGPSATPPNSNAYGAVNVSSAGQSKVGGLVLNTGGGTNALVIPSGNVGIGTTSPVDRLTVYGGGLSLSEMVSSPAAPAAGYGRLFVKKGGTSAVDGYTKLLLEMEGSSNAFVDSSPLGKAITANGNATQSIAQYKFGSKSGYLDGNGDYLSVSNSSDSDWVFGSGDFTVDFWYYRNGCSALNPTDESWIAGTGSGSGNGWAIRYVCSVDRIDLYVNSSYANWLSAGLSTGSWKHVAVVRSSGSAYLFINGTQIGSLKSISDSNSANATNLQIGRQPDWAGGYINGYIDEFRISKGIARWTSNFTPPTSPYSAAGISSVYYQDSAGNEIQLSGTTIVNQSAVVPALLSWPGSAHFESNCTDMGGAVVTVSGKTICQFSASSGANASCPANWSQANNWSETAGCSSADGNRYGNEQIRVYCGIASADISSPCQNSSCSDYSQAYSVNGHSWSDAAVEELKDGPYSGSCDCGYGQFRWDGTIYQAVEAGSTSGCMSCAGGVGYRWITARTSKIGCY